MKGKPYKFMYMCPMGDSIRALQNLDQMFSHIKAHLQAGGLPKIEVELRVSADGLRGKSFDSVIIDEIVEDEK